MYVPSAGIDDRAAAVLAEQRRVVAGGQLEPLARRGSRRTGRRTCSPSRIPSTSTREPLALLALDDEVIDVLVIDDAVDGAR